MDYLQIECTKVFFCNPPDIFMKVCACCGEHKISDFLVVGSEITINSMLMMLNRDR